MTGLLTFPHHSAQGTLASDLKHTSGPLYRLYSGSPPPPNPALGKFLFNPQVEACRSVQKNCKLFSDPPSPTPAMRKTPTSNPVILSQDTVDFLLRL